MTTTTRTILTNTPSSTRTISSHASKLQSRLRRNETPIGTYDEPGALWQLSSFIQQPAPPSDRTTIILYILLWSLVTSLYSVLEKNLLNAYPYPLSFAAITLGTASLCNFSLWVFRARKAPKFRKIRLRHAPRILGSAALHACATVLTQYSVKMGPASTALVLRTIQITTIAQPFGFFPMTLGVALCVVSFPQAITTLAANVCLTARSKIPFDPSRFRGPQNLFGLVTIASFLLATPVALIVEGIEFWNVVDLILLSKIVALGLLYFACGEVTFKVFKEDGFRNEEQSLIDSMRRALSFVTTAVICDETVVIEGALLAFGGFYFTTLAKSSALHALSVQRQRSGSDSETSVVNPSLLSASSTLSPMSG